MKKRIAVLASGEGTTFEAIIKASLDGILDVDVVGVMTDREAAVLERARAHRLESALITPRSFSNRSEWDAAVVAKLREWRTDWVVCAGYLALIGPKVLQNFAPRIVNTHPALLPNFGGAGMYGLRVHRAVLAAGEKESGVTVHLVNADFDRGQIIAQSRVPVEAGDTPERLAARVQTTERRFYPEVLARLITEDERNDEEFNPQNY